MSDNDRKILLLTCSGVSHTGKLTTRTGTWLRYRHPILITRHLQLTALKRPLDEELRDEENLVAVDGCEECCLKKRMNATGTRSDVYIVATREGIIKRGMEEVRSEEIEALSQVIVRKVRE
ncbi:MAG: putative zinc-binding protein [Euryarchaeota archaeon]